MKKWKKDMFITFCILIPLISVISYYAIRHDKIIEALESEGIKTTGVVTKITRTTRGDDIHYKFYSNGKVFTGLSDRIRKHYHDFRVGDSIVIVFLPQDPGSNKPDFQLKQKISE